jgi:AraC family ethanolamine operon transcriptional activator
MIRRIFYDVDAFADAVEHLNVRYMLLGPPNAPWELRQLALGEIVVQWCAAGAAHVCEGRTPPGVLTLMLGGRNANRMSADGVQMDDRSPLIVPPSGEFCFASDGCCQWVAVTVPEYLISAADERGLPTGLKAIQVRGLDVEAAGRFRSALDRLFAQEHEDPTSFTSPPTILAASVLRELVKATQAVLAAVVQREIRCRAIPRVRIVHRAVQYLRDHDHEAVSVDDLAEAAGVCERTLRTAFCEYYRTGPHHFLKLRQLHQAHRTLRSADPHSTTVTKVAMGLGVWELGKFARDYRMLFGETPSATLRGGALIEPGGLGLPHRIRDSLVRELG